MCDGIRNGFRVFSPLSRYFSLFSRHTFPYLTWYARDERDLDMSDNALPLVLVPFPGKVLQPPHS